MGNNFVQLFIIVIVVFIVFFIQSIVPNFFPKIATVVAFPIWQVKNSVANNFTTVADFFRSKESLLNENRMLKERLAFAEKNLIGREMLGRENDALRQLLRMKTGLRSTLAEDLVKPPQSAYDSINLDIGQDKGVKIGDKVMYLGETILGEIIEVGTVSSKAKLYSTAGNKINATLEKENISVTLSGLGGGNFEGQLPREINVAIGEFFVTPGSPRFILGVVKDIELTAADSFQKIFVKSPVNILELRWVQIENHQ